MHIISIQSKFLITSRERDKSNPAGPERYPAYSYPLTSKVISMTHSHISLKFNKLLAFSRPLLGVNATGISDRLDLVGALLGLAKRQLVLRSLKALFLTGEKGVHGSVELVAAVEEVELHHEEETDKVATELADERAGCGSGATWNVTVSWVLQLTSPKIDMTYR
jgi:hypothetical protein